MISLVLPRIVHTGTGEMIPLEKLTVEFLRESVARVLSDATYRGRAQVLQREIAQERPFFHAYEVLETSLLSKTARTKAVNI